MKWKRSTWFSHFNFVNNTFLRFIFIGFYATLFIKATIIAITQINVYANNACMGSPCYLNIYPKQTLKISITIKFLDMACLCTFMITLWLRVEQITLHVFHYATIYFLNMAPFAQWHKFVIYAYGRGWFFIDTIN